VLRAVDNASFAVETQKKESPAYRVRRAGKTAIFNVISRLPEAHGYRHFQ